MARGEGRFVVCPSASAAPGDLPGHRRLGALRLALMASFVPPLLRGEGGGGEGAGGGGDGPSDGCESDRLLLRRVPDEMDIASPDFSVSSEMGRQPFNSIAA